MVEFIQIHSLVYGHRSLRRYLSMAHASSVSLFFLTLLAFSMQKFKNSTLHTLDSIPIIDSKCIVLGVVSCQACQIANQPKQNERQ